MLTLKGNELLLYPNNASREGPYRHKVLLCLHCWGITTIRCPSMLAYGLANNNLVSIVKNKITWLLLLGGQETGPN